MLVLYFHSRKNFNDKSTWGKEQMPPDCTLSEVRQAAKLAGCEGYAIINSKTKKIKEFKWFI